MGKLNNYVRVLAYGIIISFLLPVMKIGSIGFKPDLLFLTASIPFLLFSKISFSILRTFFVLMILIFLSMFISNNLGTYYLGQGPFSIVFPTDFYQVFSRITGFAIFFIIGFRGIISYDRFRDALVLVFLAGLLFGLLQFLNFGIVKDLSLRFYALTETQMSGFQSLNFRGFGTAGNIITWGGLCGFIFYFFYFLVDNFYLRLCGCLLAIFNVLITASRSALLALGVSFVIIYLYNTIFVKKNLPLFIKNTVYFVVVCAGLLFVAKSFIPDRLEYLEIRFMKSEEDLTEGGRGAQMQYFLSILDENESNYIFGIGKPVLNDLGYMEMEPLFLIVAYGVVGIFLHYLLVAQIFLFSTKLKKININIFLFVVSSLICYLIFSIGFFFFREPYSGMLYWCVLGFLLGYSYNLHYYFKNYEKP